MLNVKINDKAPEFCLPDKDEKNICLKDYNGKWVVLYFYPKDMTSGCTIEAIDFTSKLPDFVKKNAVVIGVSPDSPKRHQKFIDKHELKVILASDEEKKMLEEYGVWQEKKMYGKTYFGVVRTTMLINPEGIISEIWNKVRVKEHVQSVFDRLVELQQ